MMHAAATVSTAEEDDRCRTSKLASYTRERRRGQDHGRVVTQGRTRPSHGTGVSWSFVRPERLGNVARISGSGLVRSSGVLAAVQHFAPPSHGPDSGG